MTPPPDFAALAREMAEGITNEPVWSCRKTTAIAGDIAAKLSELYAQWTKEEREAVLFDIFTAIGPKDGGAIHITRVRQVIRARGTGGDRGT